MDEPIRIVGIAGGSGSGKSTLAISLYKQHSDISTILHVDDYFKKTAQAPRLGEFTNWDHPESIKVDDIYRDLLTLLEGRPITILTKSELYNPGYEYELRNKIEHTIEPKPIIILEGYLALYDPRILDLMSFKVYLDIPIEESTKRRGSNKFTVEEPYFKKVLVPMHKEFVESTRQYADLVIDVLNKSQQEVFDLVEDKIFKS